MCEIYHLKLKRESQPIVFVIRYMLSSFQFLQRREKETFTESVSELDIFAPKLHHGGKNRKKIYKLYLSPANSLKKIQFMDQT